MPVLSGPRLVTGHDLKDLGLQPGPVYSRVLTALEQERVEGRVLTRADALAWVVEYLARQETGQDIGN